MGWFSKFTDDVLGLDPGGGGIYNVARDVLGDKIADDVLGMDPSGGGAIGFYNAAIPLAAGYYGYQALGGTEGISNMLGGGAGGAAAGSAAGAGSAGLGASLGGALSTLGQYAGPLASVGGALLGGKMSSDAARDAAATTGAAADRATALQREMFERQVALQEPFRQAGVNALNKLAPLASEYTPFGMQQFQQDPGYAFRMSEGMKGLERSAAARGGLLSGATLKGIQRYGQDLGSQEYQNAFNRYQTERSARLNPLQSLAGVGQTSANTIGQAGAQFANTAGNIGMNQSNVAANALLAGQQARSSSYGQLGNVLGRYLGGGGGFGSSLSNRDIERQYLGMD